MKTREHANSKDNRRFNKLILLKILTQLDKNICHFCHEKIEGLEEYHMHHLINWRMIENEQLRKQMFYDLRNISFAHRFCHTPDSTSGTGETLYIGLCKVKYSWGFKWQARIPHPTRKQFIYVGQSSDEIESAQMRDRAILSYYNGKGRLNFPHLKEIYLKEIENGQKQPAIGERRIGRTPKTFKKINHEI